jgi:hypothetical protein
MASPERSLVPGDSLEVSQAEADRLIAAGFAFPDIGTDTIRHATAPMATVEKAIIPKPKKK